MVAVQELWGENPPTVKALTLRLSHLKKLAREHDGGNSAFTTSGGRGRPTVKKEEGYVTPISSPKVSAKTPKKVVKKRVTEEVAEKVVAEPRRTRRKVNSAKYVEPELDFESSGDRAHDVKAEDDEDGDDEWKPRKTGESDGDEEVTMAVEKSDSGEEAQVSDEAEETTIKDEVVGLENKMERVTDEIKDVSTVLQENMNGE